MNTPPPEIELSRKLRVQLKGYLAETGIVGADADVAIDLALHAANEGVATVCRVCETAPPTLFLTVMMLATSMVSQFTDMGSTATVAIRE